MNVRSAAGVLTVLLWISASAPTAETHPIPPSGVFYPESVDQAVLHDAACMQSNSSLGLPPDTARQLEATVKSLGSFSPQAVLPPRAARKTPIVAKLKDYPEVPRAIKEAIETGRVSGVILSMRGNWQWGRSLPCEYIVLYLFFDNANLLTAARSCLDKAVVEYPADPEPWVFLGEIAIDENRIAEAENDFNQAKRLLVGYKNTERKPRIEKRVSRGIAEITKVRKDWKMRLP